MEPIGKLSQQNTFQHYNKSKMSTKQGQRQIKTVRCPYIPQHIMPEESLLNHLSRCTAQNKHLFTKCKYNPIHVYPTRQIEEHYKRCKDRIKYEEQHHQSSDDWGSDDQRIPVPQSTINRTQKRQGNRTREMKEKKAFDASCIKKIEGIDSDDSWDAIDIGKKQQSRRQQTIERSTKNESKSRKVEKSSLSSEVNKSYLTAQNQSFNQQSSVYSKEDKNSQQDVSVKSEQKNYQCSSSEGISLISQSFSSRNEEKEDSKSIERSFESMKYKKSKKNGDNQKNASNRILTKSRVQQNFEVEEF